VPLASALVTALESGAKATTTEDGHYVLSGLSPGTCTLVVTKEGFVRQVRSDVLVSAGRLTEVDFGLVGEFTDMDEFVVEDLLELVTGSEAALLQMRIESASMVDSIGADLIGRAGAGDAASALRLVAGATVQDGKYAVVRGLPDRYVSSQMNGVRLPTADEDKRAVQLDQFPASVIESIEVRKTFTPDQQGDASGGAVDLRLKSIPELALLQFKGQLSWNQNSGGSSFLSYDGGGLDFWGDDGGDRDVPVDLIGQSWQGAAGVTETDAPQDGKMSLSFGGKRSFDDDEVKIGGFASLFYERDSSYYDDGIEDRYWVDTPGQGMIPKTSQGTPGDGDFRTSLFDVTQGSQSVNWGGDASLGLETEHHAIGLSYFRTHTAEDKATLAIDTRGKEYFFPGYDPYDLKDQGNLPENLKAAPYLRLETLEYTERTADTLQLDGRHDLPFFRERTDGPWQLARPKLDWTLSHNTADLWQPDKRQFGALWLPSSSNPGFPPTVPPFTTPETWLPFLPDANFNLGNFQRIWKRIDETSNQVSVNLELPFTQWSGEKGYLKTGVFADRLDRDFDQDTYSNFDDQGASYQGGWDDPWSGHFPFEDHPITASDADVDYRGDQDIEAVYGMADVPLASSLHLIGGARFESTELSIVNDPEADAVWYPPGSPVPVTLNPGDADVDYSQDDVLPSIGLTWRPIEGFALRTSYSETVARQTFKELTPIQQQEFAGGPVFIGNPELQMSALENYDVRAEYVPHRGGLLSAGWFHKRVDDPIEYVQRLAVGFDYTTPVNYPKGELSGFEVEVRQGLEPLWSVLKGVTIGANATWVDSEVTLPEDEAAGFDLPGILAPMSSRDMTGAPEHLYNLFVTYDIEPTSTQISLFYTVKGDTLVAGATQADGNFVPSVYAKEYDTLNLSVAQKLWKNLTLVFQAKNLTDPRIEEVYRSEYIGGDVVKSSHTEGIEYSIAIGASFSF
jgi:outer membrane receptor protein involved in Fe transport